MTTRPWETHDRLARALQTLRMRGLLYTRSDLTAPWALRMPTVPDSLSFHVVTSGACRLEVESGETVELAAGDLALVPHGRGHVVAGVDGADGTRGAGTPRAVEELPQRWLGEHYSVLEHGGGGARTQLVCGIVAFDEPAARELARRLPAVLVTEGDASPIGSAIRDTLRLMVDELTHPRPGGEAVATRLADILVVQVIRDWLARDDAARDGWLTALQDERIGRALDAVHAEPGGHWSVERLARTATMSRSTFAARFAELVGETPNGYVTRWRMRIAQERLASGTATASQVAAELGYRSDAAFSRAFVRTVGQTPGSVRTAARASSS
ncbi:cupin domain-containing protein [Georgenia sp. Z1491]|uniref:AraC family transcriptional regulator n=1 Tax=Georgenia sp. Z1491 TaxID=3416707 RepID=UPI003CE93606